MKFQKLPSNLLKVFLFWWFISLIYWAFSSDAAIIAQSNKLASFWSMVFGTITLPESITLRKLFILKAWTLPVFVSGLLFAIAGVAGPALAAHRFLLARFYLEHSEDRWKGLRVSIGNIPRPEALRYISPNLSRESFKLVSDAEFALIDQILGTLKAYPEAYCGDGHGVTLFEHTLNVVAKTIELNPDYTGQQLIVAAAHDLGKITAFVKQGDAWVSKKPHDKESVYLLYNLPAADLFDVNYKRTLSLAIAYNHTPGDMPVFENNQTIKDSALKLLEIAHKSDMQATSSEKQKVLENVDLDQLVFNSFTEMLPKFLFRRRGVPSGTKTVGWKLGNKLYCLEIELRERCLSVLDKDVAAALGGQYRGRTEIHPFTQALLLALYKRKMLVLTVDDMTVNPDSAIWIVKAGAKSFNGVVLIQIPDNLLDYIDPKDTHYDMLVEGPMFGTSNKSKQVKSLDALFIAPSSSETKKPDQPAKTAQIEQSPLASKESSSSDLLSLEPPVSIEDSSKSKTAVKDANDAPAISSYAEAPKPERNITKTASKGGIASNSELILDLDSDISTNLEFDSIPSIEEPSFDSKSESMEIPDSDLDIEFEPIPDAFPSFEATPEADLSQIPDVDSEIDLDDISFGLASSEPTSSSLSFSEPIVAASAEDKQKSDNERFSSTPSKKRNSDHAVKQNTDAKSNNAKKEDLQKTSSKNKTVESAKPTQPQSKPKQIVAKKPTKPVELVAKQPAKKIVIKK